MSATRRHGTRGPDPTRAARIQRDAAIERGRSLTKGIAFGSVAVVAVAGVYLSQALPGHTTTSTTTSGGSTPAGAATPAGAGASSGASSGTSSGGAYSGGSASYSSPSAPAYTPAPAYSQAPVVSSGSS